MRGTIDHEIYYQGRDGLDIVLDVHGFVDAYWDGDLDHRRYTSGYVFNPFGGALGYVLYQLGMCYIICRYTYPFLVKVGRLDLE